MTVKNLKYNTYLLVKIVGIFFYRQHTVNGNRFPLVFMWSKQIYIHYIAIFGSPFMLSPMTKNVHKKKIKFLKIVTMFQYCLCPKKSHHEIMNFAISVEGFIAMYLIFLRLNTFSLYENIDIDPVVYMREYWIKYIFTKWQSSK